MCKLGKFRKLINVLIGIELFTPDAVVALFQVVVIDLSLGGDQLWQYRRCQPLSQPTVTT
jgi:hypothetical protein